jgi:hypothetical protein
MILVRYYDPVQGLTTVKLTPRPTEVDYPEKRLMKTRTTKDGAVVVQRPMADARPRRWTWKGYRPVEALAAFESLWALLESLETKTLWERGAGDGTVEIWDGESTIGGFDRLSNPFQPPDLVNYTNLVFTRVKFIQVDRKVRKGGGPVIWDEATVEFVLADDTFSSF